MSYVRRLASAALTVAAFAALVAFWPAHLGGQTRTVIVSGTSMEPTYRLGDLVVVRSGAPPSVGDVVVFAVPEGTGRGMLVIHRVVEVDDDGRLVTQGDNRDTVDQWPLTRADVVGTPILRIPFAGRLAMAVSRWPVTAAGLGAMMTVLMWPRRRDDADDPVAVHSPNDDTTALWRVSVDGAVDLDDDPWAGFGEYEIDPEVMADAAAWVDRQLAELLGPDDRGPDHADQADAPLRPDLPRREARRASRVVASPDDHADFIRAQLAQLRAGGLRFA